MNECKGPLTESSIIGLMPKIDRSVNSKPARLLIPQDNLDAVFESAIREGIIDSGEAKNMTQDYKNMISINIIEEIIADE